MEKENAITILFPCWKKMVETTFHPNFYPFQTLCGIFSFLFSSSCWLERKVKVMVLILAHGQLGASYSTQWSQWKYTNTSNSVNLTSHKATDRSYAQEKDNGLQSMKFYAEENVLVVKERQDTFLFCLHN